MGPLDRHIAALMAASDPRRYANERKHLHMINTKRRD